MARQSSKTEATTRLEKTRAPKHEKLTLNHMRFSEMGVVGSWRQNFSLRKISRSSCLSYRWKTNLSCLAPQQAGAGSILLRSSPGDGHWTSDFGPLFQIHRVFPGTSGSEEAVGAFKPKSIGVTNNRLNIILVIRQNLRAIAARAERK